MSPGRSGRGALPTAACLLALLAGVSCSRPPASDGPAPPPAETGARPDAVPGTRAAPAPGPQVDLRLVVGRCADSRAGLAHRAGMLGPSEPICALVYGRGDAAPAQLRLRSTGEGSPAIDVVLPVASAPPEGELLRFDPEESWPVGDYRLSLTVGEREAAFWELAIRTEGAATEAIAE